MNKLKEYMQVKKNPELAIFNAIEEMKKKAVEIANDQIEKEINKFSDELKELRAILKVEKGARSFNVGLDGISQIKGDKGERGDKPIAGVDFRLPQDGYAPKKGIDYFDGYTPKKGVDYFDGEKGDSIDKEDVVNEVMSKIKVPKDGSPDTGEEIIKKINKDETKLIKRKKIEGLEEEIKRLDQNTHFKKGGGMGNVITETPTGTVNGTNDTFTLSYIPKSNSLILLWQGQFQRSGAGYEYMISGKKITFNAGSIPTAGELYAWYVR